MKRGDRIVFTPKKRGAAKRHGVVESIVPLVNSAMVRLDGDPFAVKVEIEQPFLRSDRKVCKLS